MFNDIVVNILKSTRPTDRATHFFFSLHHGFLFLFFSFLHKSTLVVVFFLPLFCFVFVLEFAILLVFFFQIKQNPFKFNPHQNKKQKTKQSNKVPNPKNKSYLNLISTHKHKPNQTPIANKRKKQ